MAIILKGDVATTQIPSSQVRVNFKNERRSGVILPFSVPPPVHSLFQVPNEICSVKESPRLASRPA